MKNLLIVALLAAFAFVFSSYGKERSVSEISKSLVFPVAGNKSKIGSFWGEVRGGGTRKHRGIDIFASKGTPLLAVADGVVTSVGNGPISGKTVWLRTSGHGITAYYAHLDKQKVKVGQRVRKGDVIGTVGKTGNARTTPAHLHFGIYTRSGAVNPLPYVKRAAKIAAPVKKKTATAPVKSVKKPASKTVKR